MKQPCRPTHAGESRDLGRFDVEKHGDDAIRAEPARFGRMFPLQPLTPTDSMLESLAAQMQESAANPSGYSDVPAGYILLGQLIAHDLSYDRTHVSDQTVDPLTVPSLVSPRLDLDAIYGGPPATAPAAPTDPNDGAKLAIDNLGDPNKPDDLPRDAGEVAKIPDPRNDENLMLCQLHLAFLKLHNRFVDQIRKENAEAGRVESDATIFGRAKRRCQFSYQWMIVNDYLPLLAGADHVLKILKRQPDGTFKVTTRFYTPDGTGPLWIPIEFSVAAFRFGHTMVGPTYDLNDAATKLNLFGPTPDATNLNGGRAIPLGREITWSRFFRFPDPAPTASSFARLIDPYLPAPMATLPIAVLPPGDPQTTPFSLALRDLKRARQYGLPSGQTVAEKMKELEPSVNVLTNHALGLDDGQGWNGHAPLWFYILKESAGPPAVGKRLGSVGAWIVAEVLLKILERDKDSYLNADPGFRPDFTNAGAALPTMGNLLAFATGFAN